MAIRLHFIVEGQTEETFVNQTLLPHLANFSIWVKARCVMTSHKYGVKRRGGVGKYAQTKKDIMSWIREDQNQDNWKEKIHKIGNTQVARWYPWKSSISNYA